MTMMMKKPVPQMRTMANIAKLMYRVSLKSLQMHSIYSKYYS